MHKLLTQKAVLPILTYTGDNDVLVRSGPLCRLTLALYAIRGENKMKKTLAVLLAVVVALAFTGCAKKAAKTGLTLKDGVLTVGMEIGYPPFEYFDEDGKTPIGFDVELG